jgi:hypothetical protein
LPIEIENIKATFSLEKVAFVVAELENSKPKPIIMHN